MDILTKLKQGHANFRQQYAQGEGSHMAALADGQSPQVLMITCSDSRVDPAVIFQCDPGELFMVRNVANIVPPYENDNRCHGTSAALEFGIRHLEIPHIIIMGHSQCGGIQALMSKQDMQSDFIEHWVESISKQQLPLNCADACAQAALHQSYNNCESFPWIKERIDQGKLHIHRWFFDIGSGSVLAYDSEADDFLPLG